MGRYIYKHLLLIIVCSCLGSCRLYQNRDKEGQWSKSDMLLHQKQVDLQYRLQHDSQSRYWLFWSDSSFRFHPETGLSGSAGTVLMQESWQSTQMLNKIVDSRQELEAQSTEKSKIEKSNWRRLTALWGAGLVLLLIFIGWRRKFFKL